MLIADWRIDIWIEIHLSYSSGVNRGGRVFDAFAPICFSFILRFIRFPEPVDNFFFVETQGHCAWHPSPFSIFVMSSSSPMNLSSILPLSVAMSIALRFCRSCIHNCSISFITEIRCVGETISTLLSNASCHIFGSSCIADIYAPSFWYKHHNKVCFVLA